MDMNKKQRKVLRVVFTKGANELDQLLVVPGEIDGDHLRKIQVCFELLVNKHNELKRLDGEIYEVLLTADSSEDNLLAEMESCETYDRRFIDLKFRCENLVAVSRPVAEDMQSVISRNSDAVSSNRMTGRRKFRLPTIEFKKFDGNIRDWLPFWAQFRKVHEDPDIDQADKIEYLIQVTVANSRARQLVESFPAVGENYNKIISALQSRFGRDDLQIEVYVRELLKLIISNATSPNKMDISTLYDRLETQLRALETLGVTSEKCSAMLFSLIESCMPEDLLRVWQRVGHREEVTTLSSSDDRRLEEKSLECHLRNLMSFIKNEVNNEQRIALAAEGFGLCSTSAVPVKDHAKSRKPKNMEYLPTAAGLINCDVTGCIFCQGRHESETCFKARNFTLERKRDILSNRKACFRCMKVGHQSKKCRGRLRCVICNRPHVVLMCPELPAHKQNSGVSSVRETGPEDIRETISAEQTLANNTSCHVFLNTLRVTVGGVHNSREVRALIDSGSQKSYVLKSTAQKLGLRSKRSERIIHCLFGGTEQGQTHDCFDVNVSYGNYLCTFEVLDQPMICKDVPPVFHGPWSEELEKMNIHIADTHQTGSIELLIGADVAGKLYTGRRHVLQCGLVAIETLLGWTLMGKIPFDRSNVSTTMTVLSLFVKEAPIANLWELDVLGIREPTKEKTLEERALAAKDFFIETVTKNCERRYEVRLPWIEGHPPLPENYDVARRRLDATVRRVKNNQLLEDYDRIFLEWVQDGIIEEVDHLEFSGKAHYLPHRPVIKESSATTKIRPVFDASSRVKNQPSLNQCLEKGQNLIELIPSVLLRFREHKIGVVSDIRKAFLQISVHESDRDFLRFLWIDSNGNQKIFRHRRVVFGVSSSPFLLGATIGYHLSESLKKCSTPNALYSEETIHKLANSFYMDDCVTSVDDADELRKFIRESSIIMAEAKFDLRGWEFTQNNDAELPNLSVLGLEWNPTKDTLAISEHCLKETSDLPNKLITKRLILSVAQRIFDPIGFTCPAMLTPKLQLQKTWRKELAWDTPVDEEIKKEFCDWAEELPLLRLIEVPRWISGELGETHSLHTFCDASKYAYSAIIFLRTVRQGNVVVHLLAAKTRVAPLKEITIPRMELLATTIGDRLYSSLRDILEHEVDCFFWSDSSTALSWIRRAEEWSTFVGNRVREIRTLTALESWRHVPGSLNPADLPSRGCSPRRLLESRWWEGPKWLYDDEVFWPRENFECNEEEISLERKKRLVTTMFNWSNDEWRLNYFSKYLKTIRSVAWIFRFVHNARSPTQRCQGELTVGEIDRAEVFVFKIIQHEAFANENTRLATLDTFCDGSGLIRLRSSVATREDFKDFRFPVVLPAKHDLVNRLIFDTHERSCHVGTQGLLSMLREKYWILGGRHTIRSVISKCVICKRYSAKRLEVPSPPLPLDRVRDAGAFEVTGVDFAGPLYLKSGRKAWVCLFTCAVYRGVHLELTTSLSTTSFIQVLRRFIARRGRPKTIYSDNGTNFVGTDNAFRKLDWQSISEYSAVQRITWRFNPPTGAWWGGFWERLVGLLKQLLRKVLGRASLSYEELLTVICDCEAIVNARPLTYMSNESKELIALTPTMFLRDVEESGVPDCDAIDRTSVCRRLAYKQQLREILRSRFRIEYLGQLKLTCDKRPRRPIALGEMVLIGNDKSKRSSWPLGRVVELIPGKDGRTRLARVNMVKGQLLRPVQRLYPLELGALPNGSSPTDQREPCSISIENKPEEDPKSEPSESAAVSKSRVTVEVKVTRSGRISKPPELFY